MKVYKGIKVIKISCGGIGYLFELDNGVIFDVELVIVIVLYKVVVGMFFEFFVIFYLKNMYFIFVVNVVLGFFEGVV